ncbi:unnamed protein product [Camellia sinensis]
MFVIFVFRSLKRSGCIMQYRKNTSHLIHVGIFCAEVVNGMNVDHNPKEARNRLIHVRIQQLNMRHFNPTRIMRCTNNHLIHQHDQLVLRQRKRS